MKYLKLFFRLLLGLFMTYAGYSHLTHARQEFIAQVPTWLQFSPEFTDSFVLASGIVEISIIRITPSLRQGPLLGKDGKPVVTPPSEIID